MPQNTSENEDNEDVNLTHMFTSPPTPPLPEATFARFERPAIREIKTDGDLKRVLSIRLVGTHPLWGHYLWNAARAFAIFMEHYRDRLCHERNILELGAGGGLPGIIAALCGANRVVLTDYPDAELLNNLRMNVKGNVPSSTLDNIDVQGYIWGRDVTELLSPQGKFDVILMSDLIFNHSQHDALLQTAELCLADRENTSVRLESGFLDTPCVLVFYTHHRPHLADRDLQFFTKARERGWNCKNISEERFEPMFPDDPGDSNVRGTVHGWQLSRRKQGTNQGTA